MNKQIELITTKQSRASVPQRSRKRALSRADWLVPVWLILLTAIPALGGVLGLIGFARGVALTPDDTQFHALPLPIVLQLTPEGLQEKKQYRSALRYVFPQEMEALLFYNGFQICSCYGNWQQEPLTATSPYMIYVCQRRV
jgi:hypothetical protein